MENSLKNKIIHDFSKNMALTEVNFLRYNGRAITEASSKDMDYFYEGNQKLYNEHQIFLNWMNSTMARFIISRCIIADYYAKKTCTLSTLEKQTQFTRNAITEIIKVSEESGWIFRHTNKFNKSEMLITPTPTRIKFWEIYCKLKFFYNYEKGMDDSYQMMKALYYYDQEDTNLMVINK